MKFGTNPSTIFLVIVVTDRHTQTHKPTPVETYSLAFRRIMKTYRTSLETFTACLTDRTVTRAARLMHVLVSIYTITTIVLDLYDYCMSSY